MTNYVDVSKFDYLLSICVPFEINKLDLNEVCEVETLEAFFSVPEDYHMGKEKRKLFVFSNPNPQFLEAIVSHTEIKYILILNSDRQMAESDTIKNAKNVVLYSTKTGIFNPEIETDMWDDHFIAAVGKPNATDPATNIEELYIASKDFYLMFASEDNAKVRDRVAKFTPHQRKVLLPKVEQFIHAYFDVDIIIAGNGARHRNPHGNEGAENAPSALETSPNTQSIPAESTQSIGEDLDAVPKELEGEPIAEIQSAPKKRKTTSKKSSKKSIQEEADYQPSIPDTIDPIVAEQQEDLLETIREAEELRKQALEKPKVPPMPKLNPPPKAKQGTIESSSNIIANHTAKDAAKENANEKALSPAPNPLAQLHPPNGAKIVSIGDTSNKEKLPSLPAPDQKSLAWKGEFARVAGIDRMLYRVFCQVLGEYKGKVESPKFCTEIVTPEQIYIELRSGQWASKIPNEFTNKWLYLHVLNQLKSKPHSLDTEFSDMKQTMEGLLANFPFIEPPDYELVYGKVQARLQHGPIGQPAPKNIAAPPAEKPALNLPVNPSCGGVEQSVIKKKVKLAPADPRQELRDSIRLVKSRIAAGEIEDFEAYTRAMQKILEFISEIPE